MNLDSNIVQKTIQSLLTDVTPKVLTSPDISNAVLLTDSVQNVHVREHYTPPSSSFSQKKHKEDKGESPITTRHKTEQKFNEKKHNDDNINHDEEQVTDL